MNAEGDVVGEGCFAPPRFHVTSDPELPSSGDWTMPAFWFDQTGEAHEGPAMFNGLRRTILVEPTCRSRWVGVFRAGTLGGPDALAFTPDPERLVCVVRGLPYLITPQRPEDGAVILREPVTRVVAAPDAGVLLLVSFSEIVALGAGGVLWESPRLCLDDLEVVATTANHLRCRGYFMDGTREIVVSAATGRPEGDALVWQ